MKKVEAIVRPERLGHVRRALEEVGYPGLTLAEVKGHGKQRGITMHFRGSEFVMELVPKVKLELVVPDERVDVVVEAILQAARTGQIGDGKVFVSTIDEAVRVRTGERGPGAL